MRAARSNARATAARVARLPHERDVVRRLIPHRRRAGLRGLHGCGHRGQRLVLDEHQRRPVGCLGGSLRDDQRDGITHVAHAVSREGRSGRDECGGPVAPLASGIARQRPEPVSGVVGAGEHEDHASRCRGRRHVDGTNARVSVRRAHDDGVRLARQIHVVRVAAQALHEVGIFEATDGLSHGKFFDDQRFAHDDVGVYATRAPN
jgi:hypothetical protein